jgi:hypothetical protein
VATGSGAAEDEEGSEEVLLASEVAAACRGFFELKVRIDFESKNFVMAKCISAN